MSSTQATQVSALLEALSSGAVEIVDLTQPLSESTPIIQLPPPFANTPGLTREEISKYDDRGPAWAWYTLTIGEHVGTHVDAPIHWVTGKDGVDIGSVEPETLVGPACVIDKTAETEQANGDYLLTVADLEGWEAEHGRIPDGAWVLLRSGWSSRAHDQDDFLNVGEYGPRTPGPDVDAARWLSERSIAGFGTETVGIDAGSAGGMDPPFPLHNFLLGAGRLGLTQLANLERLPLTGALLVVAPLRLVGGTGSPSRVFAFAPKA
ncbi:MAG: cyclase family protein [Solirubrobacteraceae bacterium]